MMEQLREEGTYQFVLLCPFLLRKPSFMAGFDLASSVNSTSVVLDTYIIDSDWDEMEIASVPFCTFYSQWWVFWWDRGQMSKLTTLSSMLIVILHTVTSYIRSSDDSRHSVSSIWLYSRVLSLLDDSRRGGVSDSSSEELESPLSVAEFVNNEFLIGGFGGGRDGGL